MLIEHRPDGLLAAISLDFPDGHHLGRHFHPQAQFLYAARGLMRLATHHGALVGRMTPQALSAELPLLGVAPWGISPRGP